MARYGVNQYTIPKGSFVIYWRAKDDGFRDDASPPLAANTSEELTFGFWDRCWTDRDGRITTMTFATSMTMHGLTYNRVSVLRLFNGVSQVFFNGRDA